MEVVRKSHNLAKRDLIQRYTHPGAAVLDVGCGYGGDLNKWKHAQANVTMCDPSTAALDEAHKRMQNLNMQCHIFHGVVDNAPREKYDVICYNFSLQYVFGSKRSFWTTMMAIKDRIKRGGRVFGCIPDSTAIIMNPKFKDEYGNMMEIQKFNGDYGDRVNVMLVDTPYYNGKFIPEPIAHKEMFITWMENNGFRLIEWSPLLDHETQIISDMYSKFCFVAM